MRVPSWIEAVEAEREADARVVLWAEGELPVPERPLPAGWSVVRSTAEALAQGSASAAPLLLIGVPGPDPVRWGEELERLCAARPDATMGVIVRNGIDPATLLEMLRAGRLAATAAGLELPRLLRSPGRKASVIGCEPRSASAPAGPEAQALARVSVLLAPQLAGAWSLWISRPEVQGAEAPPGLVSVVIPVEPADAAHLGALLLSLSGVEQTPLEVWVVPVGSGAALEGLAATVGLYAGLGGFVSHQVSRDGPRAVLARLRGEQVAVLRPAWRVYPDHFEVLRRALGAGGTRWALGRAFEARIVASEAGNPHAYVDSKRPAPPSERVLPDALLHAPGLVHAALFARALLETTDLAPLLGGDAPARAELWTRLLATERPAIAAGPLPSCEVLTAQPLEEPEPAASEVPWVVDPAELLGWFGAHRERVLEELGPANAAARRLIAGMKESPLVRAVKKAVDRRRNR